MVAQKGIKGIPIRYESLKLCLMKVALVARKLNAAVHMPRIGCGLARGNWNRIKTIIQKTLITRGVETIIYSFNQ